MKPVEFRTARLQLTMPRDEDVDRVTWWCQDPEMVRFTTIPQPYSRSDAVDFLTQMVPNGWESGTEFTWVVREPGGRAVGTVGFNAGPVTPPELRSGEVGWAIAPDARGVGYAVEAMTPVVAWAFDILNLARLVWRADVDNWPSRRVAWRLGFRVEGTIRRALPHRGKLVDGWIGTLLPDDPREPCEP